MRRRTAISLMLCSAVLAGCAGYQPRPIDPGAAADAFESRTLESEPLRRFVEASAPALASPWPRVAWDFPALTLAALHYHPEVALARARAATADSAVDVAALPPLPSVSAPLGYRSDEARESPWIVGLALGLTLETAGKRAARTEQARRSAEAGRWSVASAAWQVRARLRDRLSTLAAAEAAEARLARLAEVQDAIARMLQTRLSAGAASQPEAALARVSLARTRLALADASRRRRDARGLVAESLGLPPQALDAVTLSLDGFGPPPPPEPRHRLHRQALLDRADLRAALAEYEASQAALQLEIARQYPDLRLGPGYTLETGASEYVLSLSLPAMALGLARPAIAQARARREEAAARFAALQARALGEATRAARHYEAAWEQVAQAERLRAEQHERLARVERGFAAGQEDRLALMLARQALLTDELGRLEAIALAQQALGALEDAIQHPLDAGSRAIGALAVRRDEEASR